MTEPTEDTVQVVFVRAGFTHGDQVHLANTTYPLPRSAYQTAEEQIADTGDVYYREATEEDANLPLASETYLAPRAEHAQLTSALLTVAEVEKILKIHRNTVLTMIRKGLLTASRLDRTTATSPWRIRRSSLARYLDDDLLGDYERDLLGRPPRLLGSLDVNLDASGGTMVGTATTVTENAALASWAEEEAAEQQDEEGED